MVSDLSNLLLSSVIAHFHPAARCGSRAGGYHSRAGGLALGRSTRLVTAGAGPQLSVRRRPQLGCKSRSALASARRRPFFDEANSGNLKLNGGGSNCWNQQELHVTRCCHFWCALVHPIAIATLRVHESLVRMVRVRSRGFCRRRDDFHSQRGERLVEVEFGAIETCRGETRPERQRGSPWGPYEAHQRQGQAEQRRSPMAVASGGKLPGRHLHLSRHRAGIAGENVVKVVPRDGVSPPLPVWKFNRRRAYPANPCRSACRVSPYAIRRIISGEGLSGRGHDRI